MRIKLKTSDKPTFGGKTRSGKTYSKCSYFKSKEILKSTSEMKDIIAMLQEYEKKIHTEQEKINQSEQKIRCLRSDQNDLMFTAIPEKIVEIKEINDYVYKIGKRKYDKSRFEIGDRVQFISNGVNKDRCGTIVRVPNDTQISVKFDCINGIKKRPKASHKDNFRIIS